LDTAFFSADEAIKDNIGDQEAGVEFRRVWLSTSGEFNSSVPVYYDLNLDFAGAEVTFRDVLVGVAELPVVGSLQAGHFKEPFSLEVLTSERYVTFMERALPLAAFAPMRNTGVMIGEPVLDNRMTWALGSFTSVGDSGDAVDENGEGTLDGNYRVTGRLTGLPYQQDNRLLHLGLGGSFISVEDDSARLRATPESHLADYFVDTGVFGARYAYLLGLEAAFVYGPFSVQGEYVHTWLDATAGANPDFSGFYVSGSWFLTGESRPYKAASGVFTRIQPKRSLSLKERGPGAWELAVRYSWLDLNDAGVTGGQLEDITAGVNWYLNPNTRMMFNYIFSQVDRNTFDGDAHIFMGRVQVDF
jgi:phosphate-selective porin OprO/OprP